LKVDRQRMFDDLKRVKAWIEIDGTHDLGPGPQVGDRIQQERYVMSTCMTCGCCLEVCPQINARSNFVGAAALNQVRLFNAHPSGALSAAVRIEPLMESGGIQDCGNAQNCVKACPKHIPLTTSIAELQRQVMGHAFRLLLRR
jgi:succinate dehydrogenase / fumarate reductase iron-sulfur subunit